MKNLEIKLRKGNDEIYIDKILDKYVKTLYQKDTYLKSRYENKEKRIKIRQENEHAYAINYCRENIDSEKISNYTFYKIESVDDFMNVFGECFEIEIVVEKKRELFLYENARIHLDDVKNLGKFIEIEIVINNEEEELKSHDLMDKILNMLNLKNLEKIAVGYKDLLQEKNNIANIIKNYEYYKNSKKVYWYVNNDIPNTNFKQNQIVPAIFVEVVGDDYNILQFDLKDTDLTTEENKYKWTGWRRVIGEKYNIRVDVFLFSADDIDNCVVYKLDGTKVPFENLKYSTIHVDKSYLAKFM